MEVIKLDILELMDKLAKPFIWLVVVDLGLLGLYLVFAIARNFRSKDRD